MSEYVDFHYMPLEGKITGKQVLKQTEDAINDLGEHVYELDIDESRIDEAVEKSEQAIETAESALSAVTTDRAVWKNTVAEMKATNIDLGVTAATRGKMVFNDGNGAFYGVRSEKSGDLESDDTVFLDNGNVAERIQSMNITAKGNNIIFVANVAKLIDSDALIGNVYGTTGYYSANDGGAGLYSIRTKTQSDVEDGGSIIFLGNGNVAELITDGTVNVKQFGAVGDANYLNYDDGNNYVSVNISSATVADYVDNVTTDFNNHYANATFSTEGTYLNPADGKHYVNYDSGEGTYSDEAPYYDNVADKWYETATYSNKANVCINGVWYYGASFTTLATDDTIAIQNAVNAYSHVIVPAGTYSVKATADRKFVIQLQSNSCVDFYGNIRLETNSLSSYAVIYIGDVNNVVVNSYGGEIIGDKDTHTGIDGQLGFGVRVAASKNCQLNNIVAKNCWGDGIYIGKSEYTNAISQNVVARNIRTISNRRNGLAVSACDGAYIDGLESINTWGQNPQAGFDIEPFDDSICNVYMDNIRCLGNRNAFQIANSYSSNFNVSIGSIECDSVALLPLPNASTIEIGSITFQCGYTNNLFYWQNSSSAKIHIGKVSASGVIKILFASSGASGNINIDEFEFRGNANTFISNTSGYALDIGNFILDGTIGRSIWNNVTLNIGNMVTPRLSYNYTGSTNVLPSFPNNMVWNNDSTSTMSNSLAVRGLYDGQTIVIANVSTTGTSRIYSDPNTQIFDDNGTVSNVFVVPNGQIAIMRYNKALGKFLVLFKSVNGEQNEQT